MKKLLLFMLAFGFVFSGFAQNQMVSKKNEKRAMESSKTFVQGDNVAPVINQDKSVTEDVNRVVVGMSDNQRSFRREEPHVVSYNAELDVISITCTIDPATYGEADDLGVIGQFYSTDHGQTWEGPVVLADNLDDGFQNYYPAGIIYNPAGNTTVADAYGVSQSTNTLWNYHVFGSSTLGGENLTNYLFEDTDADYTYNGYWNQFGLNQVGDEVRAMNVHAEGDWSNFVSAELSIITADFDGTQFEWDLSNMVEVDLVVGEADGVIEWIGMYVGMDAGAEIAWSADGETGYAWMVGVSNEEPSGYQPLIYKSTDGGESWDYIHLDFLTDEMQAFLDPYIMVAGGTDLMIPHIFESAGAVDMYGNLQLFVAMGSSSSNVLIHPDSIGYHWVYPGDLFNVTVDDDGINDIIWLDSLNTGNVDQDGDGSYLGTGWGHRLYVSKNTEENQMFYTWCDTRDDVNETNVEPDIFGWSMGVCENAEVMEETVCFTEGTLYETFYYFPMAADMAFINDDGNYSIPLIQAVTPGEFSSNQSATTDPVTVNYITGIEFAPLCFEGVNDVASTSGINVTQNQPNPFNGETYIEVSTEVAAAVMVEVSNIMGQTIYTINAGTVNGSKVVSLNSENMEAGVYFYTVTVGSESITKKMVVK